jgi:cytochrome c oxidase cbb3-type subunit 3
MSEQERLLDHEYDGIREYDNPTPRWWTWIFWATIIFSLAYWINPGGWLRQDRIAEYDGVMQAAALRFPPPPAAMTAASLDSMRNDRAALDLGKTTYAATCAPCHRADAGGIIGPNLTDDYWLHGGSLVDIQRVITDGVLEKGMPPWGKSLKPEQITGLTIYIASLGGSNTAQPKAPQGMRVDAP